ncbi:hypothetical protein [Ferrimicrobium sp.]|uniref:hypothetical protein n=1 Tax=Ferrimicrobium sp. TaxID=2926050 RepID=UPI002626E9ED|nr:hypothetical protein [Ferrimicrobium sp.]
MRDQLIERGKLVLGVAKGKLDSIVADFVEADGNYWYNPPLEYTASQKTWISAILACGACEGQPLPRLLEFHHGLRCITGLVEKLKAISPDAGTFKSYADLLNDICAIVPYPAELSTTGEILGIVFEGQVPPSYLSLLELLGAPKILDYEGAGIDAIEAAREVHLQGRRFARELIQAGVLPKVVESLARSLGERGHDSLPSAVPVQRVAGLCGEASALFIYGVPGRLPAWQSVQPVLTHLNRLAEVLGFSHPPTLYPHQSLLGAIRLDHEGAKAYDRRLLEDAMSLAEWLQDSEGLSQQASSHRAAMRVMKGFEPFRQYLERAGSLGASITALPDGIKGTYKRLELYKGVRDDLSPRPEVFRQFLGALPTVLRDMDEKFGRLLILQCVTGARSSVVLGLDRTCWIPDVDGVILHVRSGSNKTGRSALFLARAWIELFDITPDWLPASARENPSDRQRQEFRSFIESACAKFERLSGCTLVRKSARFTRSAYVQLLRADLKGVEREVITACLGHRSRLTRANYVRARADEVQASYERWEKWNR